MLTRSGEHRADTFEAALFYCRENGEDLCLQTFEDFAMAVLDAGAPFPRHYDGTVLTQCSRHAPIRGSTHWEELQDLRQLRRAAKKGKADSKTMQWFRSGALDVKLAALTLEHGTGRYYDREGNAIDLRPHAFEDFLDQRPW